MGLSVAQFSKSLITAVAALAFIGLTVGAQDQAQASEDSLFRSKAKVYESMTLEDIPEGQREIVQAQTRGKGLNFVEVKDVEVVKLLPDDNHGRRHQKWMVRLANGRNMLAVYNISVSDSVPLQEGDIVSMGGQYIWDKGGGLIHWLHEDPKDRRPDGYVEVNGEVYGDFKGEH